MSRAWSGRAAAEPSAADGELPATGSPSVALPESGFGRQDYRRALGESPTTSEPTFAGPLVVLVEGDRIAHASCAAGGFVDRLVASTGRPVAELVHPDDEAQLCRLLELAVTREGAMPPCVLRIVGLDGEQRHVEFVAVATPGAQGTVTLHGWDVTAHVRRERALKTIALHDPLTELANRLLFTERVAGEVARRRRSGRDVAVLYADLDGFKAVNDTWGHRAGDLLLIALAARLRECVRPGDTVARLGGDEFGVCSPDLGSIDDALLVAHRLIEAASAPVLLGGAALRIGVSVGIALAVDADTADKGSQLIARADLAMYAAKQAGITRVAVAPTP